MPTARSEELRALAQRVADGSAEALAEGVVLRTGRLPAGWQERLADYPESWLAKGIEVLR